MKHLLRSFVREESGQDMIEYVLILAFVVIGAAAIAVGIGTDLKSVWTEASKATSNAKAVGTFNPS